MAGSAVGLWNGPDDVRATWSLDRCFEPRLDADRREQRRAGWLTAVRRTLTTRTDPTTMLAVSTT